MEKFYTSHVVVGAGVLGLASARLLAKAGHNPVVIEAEARFGMGISQRSSEVIHAGIYYPPDSLKAAHCLRGKAMLYEYCHKYDIPHKQIGKSIIASHQGQVEILENLAKNAYQAGIDKQQLYFASNKELASLRAHFTIEAALTSPTTGIIDSHAFMASLAKQAEDYGAVFSYQTKLMNIDTQASHDGQGRFALTCQTKAGEVFLLFTDYLLLAAGLYNCQLASYIQAYPARYLPQPCFAKGNYFTIQPARAPIDRLIYPVPEKGGLGVHLTVDMAGAPRFGPDVEWLSQQNPEKLDYEVNLERKDRFQKAVASYWPLSKDYEFIPAYASIRPKVKYKDNSDPYPDFLVHDYKTHNIQGLVCAYGIESPGLTASLSLAEYLFLLIKQE